jgi:DNA polymerase-3 subunit gamma/tau
MSYLVLARKYRPQSFEQMAGQEHVVRTLSNALKSGVLAHAFLFTGPRGVGKTTSARLVAKCLNCANGPTAEPCGACPPCVEIAEGRAVDVVEIDAASNNGVDNVRDIVEAVKYRPARDRFKVFVVDEVHMLSTGAFNALLKTLEEPPEHVKFVLATTDVHKVPETIVSRCQRFDFRRLTGQQIVDQLRKVAQAEGLRISDAALAMVARAAEGGMRDALSSLDQVRAACGDTADDAAVAEAVGAIDPGAVARLAGALIRRDGAVVLAEVEALHGRGQEMRRVAEELVRHLRNVVVAKLVPATPLDLPDVERDEVKGQAEAAPASQLTRLFDLAQAAVTSVKEAEQPRYAFEIALLKACFLAPGADLQDLAARLDALGQGAPLPPGPRGPGSGRPLTGGTPGCAAGPGPMAAPPARPAAPPAPAPAPVKREGAGPGPAPAMQARSEAVAPAGFAPVPAASAPSLAAPPAAAPAGFAPVAPAAPAPAPAAQDDASAPAAERWRAAVAAVEQASSALANALKQAVLVSLTEGEIALRMPTAMTLSSVERRRAEVEGLFAKFFGRPTRLALALGAPAQPGAGAEAAPEVPQSLAATEQAERAARAARVKAAAAAHPAIQGAARILEGEILKIDVINER